RRIHGNRARRAGRRWRHRLSLHAPVGVGELDAGLLILHVAGLAGPTHRQIAIEYDGGALLERADRRGLGVHDGIATHRDARDLPAHDVALHDRLEAVAARHDLA